jgi:hypothetical protein
MWFCVKEALLFLMFFEHQNNVRVLLFLGMHIHLTFPVFEQRIRETSDIELLCASS